ncbi:alpha-D-ribose 1-methylphosphonate 5-triphosphate diphosphatase [Pontivivens ytuae]|uniref:Alpha-D-ribose 1-methylphosphonate 5-triphosphate diphosphatase n=1 Tax=Pontivivens ytuae TaxID=2789856 RepID=A0A7S9QDP8_9RHOB|nr:alpha-D-ribose 1-methylphosphonate 5-triphosphate diphosphatase [Pontivivens ytuae]QPH54607.1 alpha-D-ribose 1-methylphosphonate 5-triphosphate diphosphatase [Pontivivens ytuae]
MFRVIGATVILPNGVARCEVSVEDGRIAALDAPATPGEVKVDGRGKVLAPALIDIHGDAFERQMMPRPGVMFPLDPAVLETDRQLGANGIATAFHAVTLGWEPGLRSVEQGRAFCAALERLGPRLTVENAIQLRWETFAFEAVDLIEEVLAGPLPAAIAFNDHTSMSMLDPSIRIQDRPFEQAADYPAVSFDAPHLPRKMAGSAKRAGLDIEPYLERMGDIWTRRAEVPAVIERVAAAGREAGVGMLSHDDTQDETRTFYRGLGARISEFPMRIPVAEAAKAAGDAIAFGAPNVVRGGSHIGSPSAAEMVEAGLCDMLASDYYYPAMLAAVARLHEEKRAPLDKLWRLVSAGPAEAMHLPERGEIAVGQRADLVLLDWPEGETPAVRRTWVKGRLAYSAG